MKKSAIRNLEKEVQEKLTEYSSFPNNLGTREKLKSEIESIMNKYKTEV